MDFKNAKHIQVIGESFMNQFKSQKDCDVVIIADGHRIKAHRHILSVFSTFFRQSFEENGEINQRYGVSIVFANYKWSVVQSILKYMYSGSIKADKDELSLIAKCANDLGVETLLQHIQSRMKGPVPKSDTITAENNHEGNKRKLRDSKDSSSDVESKRSKVDVINDDPKKEINTPSTPTTSSENSDVNITFESTTNTKTNLSVSKPKEVLKTSLTIVEKLDRKKENHSALLTSTPKEKKRMEEKKDLEKTPVAMTSASRDEKKRESDSDSDDSLAFVSVGKPKFSREKFNEKVANDLKKNETNHKTVSKKIEEKKPNPLPLQEIPKKPEPAPITKKPPADVKCKECGETYKDDTTHKKLSDLPREGKRCPFYPKCDKVVPMLSRALKDHLSKVHAISICEEK